MHKKAYRVSRVLIGNAKVLLLILFVLTTCTASTARYVSQKGVVRISEAAKNKRKAVEGTTSIGSKKQDTATTPVLIGSQQVSQGAGSSQTDKSSHPGSSISSAPNSQTSSPTSMSDLQNNTYGIAAGSGWMFISSSELNSRMQGLNDLGVKWLRFDMLWNNIQPNNSATYDWSNVDRVITSANAHNISVLPILDNAPPWASVNNCGAVEWCQPNDPQTFANFASAAVQRYASRGVHNWEIWNEENKQSFWHPAPDPAAYTQLLKLTYSAIKSVDSSATVITGGLGGPSPGAPDIATRDFLQDIYQDGAKGSFDAVADHPYSYPVPASYSAIWNGWQQIQTTVSSFRSIMTSNGDGNKKIWITEYGAPTNGPGTTADIGNYFNNSPTHVTEALQASMVTDVIQQYKALPYVGPFFWYSYKDSGTDPSTNENFFGLVRADGSQKPAYAAYKSAIAGSQQVGLAPANVNSSSSQKIAAVVPKPVVPTKTSGQVTSSASTNVASAPVLSKTAQQQYDLAKRFQPIFNAEETLLFSVGLMPLVLYVLLRAHPVKYAAAVVRSRWHR